MNIVVFDTETIGLNKPWAYNIGYVIYNNILTVPIFAAVARIL